MKEEKNDSKKKIIIGAVVALIAIIIVIVAVVVNTSIKNTENKKLLNEAGLPQDEPYNDNPSSSIEAKEEGKN